MSNSTFALVGSISHLLWGVLVSGQFDHLASHFVYCLDNLQHLVIGDSAIAVNVVQLERP